MTTNRNRKWSEIHRDFKLVNDDGTRWVLIMGENGGAALVRWEGPK